MAARSALPRLTLGLLLCHISEILGSASISIQIRPDVIKRGDDVYILCTFKLEDGASTDAVFMQWIRRSDGNTVHLGANNYIYNNYQSRYSADVDYDYDDTNVKIDLSTFNVTLHIKDVREEDVGEIGCREPNKDTEVFVNLVVYTPVQFVQLLAMVDDGSMMHAFDVDEEMTSQEGQVLNISCLVSGGYPKPEVTIILGTKDITKTFSTSVKEIKVNTTSGPHVVSYDVTLTNEQFTMEYDFGNKLFECRAALPGSQLPVEVKTVRLRISSHKPHFKCQTMMTTVYEPLQTNATIKCDVIAKPQVHDVRIYWLTSSSAKGKMIVSPEGKEFTTTILSGATPDAPVSAVLNIEGVSAKHYRTYIFEAVNLMGSTQFRVKLRPDKSGSPVQNAVVAGSPPASRCLTMAAILFLLTFTLS